MATMQTILGLEFGTVINEHYSMQEYVNRRAGWLRSQPHYARMPTGSFAIARRDAGDVFKSDHQLSVQEVRCREQAADVDPLLPLPTTDNTKTLDNFLSYPQREWSPGINWPAPRLSGSNDDEIVQSASLSQIATVPNAHTNTVSQTAGQSDSASLRRAMQQTANYGLKNAQITQSTFMQPANIRRSIESDPSHRSHHWSSGNSSGPEPMSSSPMAATMSTRATTPMSADWAVHLPHGGAMPSQPNLLRGIIDHLGTTFGKSPNAVHVDRSISALAGHRMHVPVKQKRGTKRAGSESREANDGKVQSLVEVDSPPSAQRPLKRIKLIGPRDPSQSPPKAAPSMEDRSEAKRSEAKKKRSPPSAKHTTSTTPAKQIKNAECDLEAVIAGTRLPESKDEAKRAMEGRHERLLAQHKALLKSQGGPKNSRADRARKGHQDFLPEFFNTENFAPGQEEDSVRCVCGVTVDDGANMVGCDECMVWQHSHCMGEGVPKSLKKTKYFCQMCDPWVHRKLIARLRKEKPIVAEQI